MVGSRAVEIADEEGAEALGRFVGSLARALDAVAGASSAPRATRRRPGLRRGERCGARDLEVTLRTRSQFSGRIARAE